MKFISIHLSHLFRENWPVASRILKGFGAQGFGKIILTMERIVEVPLLLNFWGIQIYGEWLLLSTIPSYLTVSDGGFTMTAVREMSLRSAAGDRQGVLRVFQSIQVLLGLVAFGVMSLSAVILPLLPIEDWFSFTALDARTCIYILNIFALDVLVGFYQGLLSNAFWCDGFYSRGVFIANLNELAEYIAFAVAVISGASPLFAALVLLTFRIIGVVVLLVALRFTIPWLIYGFEYASLAEIKSLTAPALATLAFPLGNALNNQGLRLIVGAVLGPADVVLFTALRTLSRLTNQLTSMINQTIQPEMSAAFGRNEIPLFANIVTRASQLAFWLMALISLAQILFGNQILWLWTKGKITMNWPLYISFNIATVINAVWYVVLMVLLSTNRHKKAALAYNLIYGVATFIMAYVAMSAFGMLGIAVVLVVSEIFMAFYVIPRALALAHIKFDEWIKQIMLSPVFLLKRLFRAKE